MTEQTAVEKRKETIDRRIKNTEDAIAAMERRMTRFYAKVRTYDEKNMEEMEARHAILADRFQQLIEKITVVTEVAFQARHTFNLTTEQREELLMAAIMAMDMPDAWWSAGGEISVSKWAERCLEAKRKGFFQPERLAA